MKLIIHWLISAVAVIIAAYLLPNVSLDSLLTALIVAIVLGLFNTVIKPVLIILTLPITILTLGLFTLVINGVLAWVTHVFVPGFYIKNFWWAIIFALVLSIVNMTFRHMEKKENR
jgi:putative membrane protein